MMATRLRYGKGSEAMYTSIFKYVIPNRRWLIKMLDDGYTFTLLTTSFKEIMEEGRKREPIRYHDPKSGTSRKLGARMV